MVNVTEKIYALSMKNKMAGGGFGRAVMGETTPLCHNPYPQEVLHRQVSFHLLFREICAQCKILSVLGSNFQVSIILGFPPAKRIKLQRTSAQIATMQRERQFFIPAP